MQVPQKLQLALLEGWVSPSELSRIGMRGSGLYTLTSTVIGRRLSPPGGLILVEAVLLLRSCHRL